MNYQIIKSSLNVTYVLRLVNLQPKVLILKGMNINTSLEAGQFCYLLTSQFIHKHLMCIRINRL